ncbi:hypothetical protein ACWGSE_24085 [Streptomyces diastaticus]|uniref:hypothetical protein n=1 Tax=Streptomyces TaxID=1883 RepID=UPI000FA27BB6|nr:MULTISPECIES: hypothetical protein [unclassified Streptomyces]MBL3806116.1 hypothetical protein [Streptomyces sp. BRB081]RPK79833.1 hypothetical protein EES47_29125 [Streptomyces sp. ADI98-12]
MFRRFRRRSYAPGPITPKDQAVVDQFHAYLPEGLLTCSAAPAPAKAVLPDDWVESGS